MSVTRTFSSTTVRVGCKINLSLRITGVRPNGYHELDSVFLPLQEPWDELHFEPTQGHGLHVQCDTADIDPHKNTLTKAYAAYAKATGFAPSLGITLHKGVPHGAGLGGGSADAAAVLRWCNAHAPHPLQGSDLEALALGIGADVPFFLHNTPCRVRGIGEILSPCTLPWSGLWLVLLCPPVYVATPWAYAAWDASQKPALCCATPLSQHFLKQSTEDLTTKGLEAKEVNSCSPWMVNDFESVVFAAHPQLAHLKEALLQQGASAAVMSGSGSSLCGLFRQQEAARNAAKNLQGRNMRVFVTRL